MHLGAEKLKLRCVGLCTSVGVGWAISVCQGIFLSPIQAAETAVSSSSASLGSIPSSKVKHWPNTDDIQEENRLAQLPLPADLEPPSADALPEPNFLPPPEDLLETTPTPDEGLNPDIEAGERTIFIKRFEVVGSTVFSQEELAAVTQRFENRALTFTEILEVRSAITDFYVQRGYVTTGAIFPPQTLQDDVARIQVIEGRLEDIQVLGTERLQASYVRDRVALSAQPPLNVNILLEKLQSLQLDPLIETISADLQAGTQPGTNLLVINITEADSFDAQFSLDNGRSPSAGSVRRKIQLTEANLLGFGDRLSLGYTNTDGSNGFDVNYTWPLNPRNGTLRAAYGISGSRVIEAPFDTLDIRADSRFYELTYRQPIIQTPTEEFVLGVTASRQESQTEVRLNNIGPFPLSPGADARGRTRTSTLQFFQEWTQRSSQHVLAFRSQVNVGLDIFAPTINDDEPDSRFVYWRGRGQWVRRIDQDKLLFLKGEIQLSDSSLLTLEQLSLGGQSTVRGYRQDQLLADNGALLSAELRLPILDIPDIDGALQVTPFIDVGTSWNNGRADPNPSTLIGIGAGLLWQQGEDLSARLDIGFPLISAESGSTLQESGVYFSINYSPF